MPEIAEVTRVVHYLRTHLVNRRISNILVQNDDIIYGRVGTSAAEFQKALTGRTVLDARRQGKYFWLVMDKPPHPLMHLGMTGWVKLSNIETGYYKPEKEKKTGKAKGDGKKQTKLTDGAAKQEVEDEKKDTPAAVYNNAGSTHEGATEWPPKYYKFVLQMEGTPKVEAAFVDARRLGRIRLIDVPAEEMRNTTPLKENGPDPVLDQDVLTVEWLTEKLQSKKNPIKAALIDQGVISGVGNWVADEILHHARVHPEQYCNTLSDAQCKQLHDSLTFVCTTACDLYGDSDQYPKDWIFKYRWSKGKKDVPVLPNGEQIQFVTAGGRTSAFVASRQKKTGPVAGDVNDDDDEADAEDKKPQSKSKSKPKARSKKAKAKEESEESDAAAKDQGEEESPPRKDASRKRKATKDDNKGPDSTTVKKAKANGTTNDTSGRRRSRRSKA